MCTTFSLLPPHPTPATASQTRFPRVLTGSHAFRGGSSGWIASSADRVAFEAQCWTLDDFLQHAGITRVDVLKLDAAGNELVALRGGEKAFRGGKVGTLVMKLYDSHVTRERFGYDSRDSVRLLREWGFQMKLVHLQDAFPILHPEDLDLHFDRLVSSHILVARLFM